MKNQYFGDINDFHKYGLLRILCGEGKLRLAVCWMLTLDDTRKDGSRTGYLRTPERWRRYDEPLFDLLVACVTGSGARDLSLVESRGFLPRTQFYNKVLQDSVDQRQRYFSEMRKKFANANLIFFDPDNGLEVTSVPVGARNSSKYLYWQEVSEVFEAKHSVLIYQHFPREDRDSFVEKHAETLSDRTGAVEIHAFRTAHVVFLLAPRKKHMTYFRHVAARVTKMWADRFEVKRYRSKRSPSIKFL